MSRGPQGPRYGSNLVRVTGESSNAELADLEEEISRFAPGALPSDRLDPAWASQELGAKATGSPPAMAPSEVTRRLMARREAVSAAWRDLAAQIEQMQVPGYGAVGKLAAADPAIQDKIQTLVRQARVVEETEFADGSIEVALSLRAEPLASFLPPTGASPTNDPVAAGPTPAQFDRRRQLQQETTLLAENDARQRLLEAIRSAPLDAGRTIGQAMDGDPYLAAQIQALAQIANVVDRDNTQPGRAEVVLEFDMARAQRAAAAADSP